MASEMPVLPLVGSITVQPGFSRPSASAAATIANAARSLIDPVGLRSSSFAHRRTSGAGDNRGNPTRGVPPTASTSESNRAISARFSGPAGNCRQDRHLVTVGQRRLQRAAGHQPLAETGVPRIQVGDYLGQGRSGCGDGLFALGLRAQDGRDGHGHAHGVLLLVMWTSSSVTTPSMIRKDRNSWVAGSLVDTS